MIFSRLGSLLKLGNRGVNAFHTVEDFRKRAKRVLPRMVFDFVDGGAEGELSVTANRSALEKVTFAPRYLANVADRDISTKIFGKPIEVPFIAGPAGLAALVHPDGEIGVAKAAKAAGSIFCVSTASCFTLEEIAASSQCRLWFQLYLWKSSEVVESLVNRAREAGYEALVVTVDVPVVGKRERDLRNGMSLPVRLRAKSVLDSVLHLPWIWRFLSGPEITFKNLQGFAEGDDAVSLGEYTDRELTDPSRTWEDLGVLRRMWKGPLLVKGIMTVEDARAAVDQGVDGIVVSNHGGRQLGSLPGAATVLPHIADAVGDRTELILDGGIRRGEDIVKAKALGATASMGGRAWFWSLAAAGETGVTRLFSILKADVDRTLALLGARQFDEVDSNFLFDENAS